MNEPGFYIDIFLQPGEFYFGDRETRIRTILGSCVSITFWHPKKHIGGMCHYMLPKNKRAGHNAQLDGKYAEDTIHLFMHEIKKAHTHPHDYEVKIFGGGNQFPTQDKRVFSVSDQNVEVGRHLLAQHGFKIKSEHMGGNGHRNIMFDIWSGDVWVKHVEKVMMP
jgi:chemotaxis protein CheD